jgi:Flp pilus assembly protein TadG
VAVVEAAFVIPVLILLILTMFDFGDWVFQVSQANGAARDGARVGIINYQDADNAAAPPPAGRTSNDLAVINQAIAKRLAGQTYTLVGTTLDPNTATCIPPDSTTALPHGCHPAIPGCDRIMVKVQWTRTPWSPTGGLFGLATVHGEAEMTIAGAPVNTATTLGTVDPQAGC